MRQTAVDFCLFCPFLAFSLCATYTSSVRVQKASVDRTSNSWLDRPAHGLDFVFDDECTRGGQVRRDVTRYFGTILRTLFSSFHPLPVIAEKNE